MNEQFLDVLQKISSLQADQAQQLTALTLLHSQTSQALAKNTEQLRLLTEALNKPSTPPDTMKQLEQLLRPLVQQLQELSRKLPEPQHR